MSGVSGGLPIPVEIGHADCAGPVAGEYGVACVGKEHPMPDVVTAGNGSQGGGAIELAEDLALLVPAESSRRRTQVRPSFPDDWVYFLPARDV